MARIIYSGRVNANATTGAQGLATVGATTFFVQVSDGGGSGNNTLKIDLQASPNPTDSTAAQVWITDGDPSSWPTTVINQDDLTFTDIRHVSNANWGVVRFNLTYAGAGSKIFAVNIWANP